MRRLGAVAPNMVAAGVSVAAAASMRRRNSLNFLEESLILSCSRYQTEVGNSLLFVFRTNVACTVVAGQFAVHSLHKNLIEVAPSQVLGTLVRTLAL